MSGIEAAGFVLAAFPLLISALEHYRESAELLKSWWRIKGEYIVCKNEIKHYAIVLEQCLEELLLPLVADEEELQALVADPASDLWKAGSLEQRLKERLSKSYDPYMNAIKEVLEVIDDLKRELGIAYQNTLHRRLGEAESVQVPKNEVQESLLVGTSEKNLREGGIKYLGERILHGFDFQAQRIKFSLNKPVREQLFDRLGRSTTRLQDILERSVRIEGLRSNLETNTKRSPNKALRKILLQAKSLHNVLAQAWNCPCQKWHMAQFLLKHRTTSNGDFKVIFLYANTIDERASRSWVWQEMNITTVEEVAVQKENFKSGIELIAGAVIESTQTSNSTQHKLFNFLSAFPKRSKSRGKRPQTDSCTVSSSPAGCSSTTVLPSKSAGPPSVTLQIPEISVSTSTSTDSQDFSVITNLCGTIALCHQNLSSDGFLKGDGYNFILRPLRNIPDTKSLPASFTLAQLLKKDSPKKLSRRQRYSIALTLASSHLQLQNTPWLNSSWNKSGIVFLQDTPVSKTTDTKAGDSMTRSIDISEEESTGYGNSGLANTNNSWDTTLKQPYITSIFSSGQNAPETSTELECSNITNLGIVLLELCFGSALEDHQARQQFPSNDPKTNPFFDLAVALKWCEEANDEGGYEFAEAIAWCLRGVSGRSSVEDEHQKHRVEFFANVVQPLENCYNQLTSI